MNKRLKDYIKRISGGIDSIPADRQELIVMLADYIAGKSREGSVPKLVFICTHNSRRSILGQVWAAAAGDYFGVQIKSYSGGTEATAFYPSALEALEKAGFIIKRRSEGPNPVYELNYGGESGAIKVFSKKYDDLTNPKTGFAAIMTCSDADEACPFIPGAEIRIPLRYEDPKIYDGTADEAARYEERSAQIAIEMFYLFSRVKGAKIN
jgi:arsenate reductase (thioredoxin)